LYLNVDKSQLTNHRTHMYDNPKFQRFRVCFFRFFFLQLIS